LPRKIFGYEVRNPYPSELDYFSKNPDVSGMATDDKRIILNPYSGLSKEQEESVLRNEATRIFLREKEYKYDFDVTPEQQQIFSNTTYNQPGNENELKSTILARAVSGDPSSGILSKRQQEWVQRILKELKYRELKSALYDKSPNLP